MTTPRRSNATHVSEKKASVIVNPVVHSCLSGAYKTMLSNIKNEFLRKLYVTFGAQV